MAGIMSVAQILDSMLGDIDYPKDSPSGQLYPFKVRVGVSKRRPPRHKFFDFFRDMGLGDIDKTLKNESFNGNKNLTFIFPERWIGVAEQQAFMAALASHPEAETLDQVDIITSSPLVISSFHREQIRILTWDDDDNYNGAL